MKIIKRGEDPTLKPVRASCMRCQTQVEFLPSESGITHTYDQREGSFYTFPCPVCAATITQSVRAWGTDR